MTTICAANTPAVPRNESPILVYVRDRWVNEAGEQTDWAYTPELEVIRAEIVAGAGTLGSCELRRRYGYLKEPWDAGFDTRTAAWMDGYWVRLTVAQDGGEQEIFVGRIAAESRDIYGGDATNGSDQAVRSGEQTWVAYSPLLMLRKIHVSTSHWFVTRLDDNDEEETVEQHIDYLPGMNSRQTGDLVRGNRSEDESTEIESPTEGEERFRPSYLHGGTELWSRKEYLNYILNRFVNLYDENGNPTGPLWRLAGQTDILADITDTHDFGASTTVAAILDKLITPVHGLSFCVRSTDEGFEIFVFSLLGEDQEFGGAKLAKNPNTMVFNADQQVDMSVRVVWSSELSHSRIRLIGRRVVVCCTLEGANWFVMPDDEGKETLVPKWSSALETEYKLGAGSGAEDEAHDNVRSNSRYRPVFQQFAAPRLWDRNGGRAAPVVDANGDIKAWGQGEESDYISDYQIAERRTLARLPLREGIDYSTNPVTNNNPTGANPDFLLPAVWLLKEPTEEADGHFIPAEAMNISVYGLRYDWGVLLQSRPNHRIAKNHWDGSNADDHEPEFDYDDLVATIAIESEQRLQLEVTLPEGENDDGTVFVRYVPDAELWYIAPETVVGVDPSNGTLTRVGANGLVLRNDASRLALIMAGLIARYYDHRARATITVRRMAPWAGLLGQIVSTIEEGGDLSHIRAPITSVRWFVTETGVETMLRTGFAL